MARARTRRRGVAITAAILGAITVASFAVWTMPPQDGGGGGGWMSQPVRSPQDGGNVAIVTSDYGGHLDGVRSIHGVLSNEVDASFGALGAGRITAQEYAEMADATSAQVRTQILRLVESKAPQEWHDSYVSYVEALRVQNSIIRETIVAAEKAGGQDGGEALEEAAARIKEMRAQMMSYMAESADAVPSP